jgi:hypothetical protein
VSDLVSRPKKKLRKPAAGLVGREHQRGPAKPKKKEPFQISRHELMPIIGNLAFAVIGLVLLPSSPSLAFICLAFFGGGGFFLAWLQWRRFQDHQLDPSSVEVVGGVRILPSKFMVSIGLGLAVVGFVIFYFGGEYPVFLQWLGALIGVFGAVIFVLALMGRFPPGFLQFEPDGLIIGRTGWQMLVPWDRIYAIEQGTLENNPIITLGVVDIDSIEITPAAKEKKARKIISGGSAWQWTPLKIFPMHYSIPTPVLVGAIRHYVENEAARRNLGRRQLSSSSIQTQDQL